VITGMITSARIVRYGVNKGRHARDSRNAGSNCGADHVS
jgi:hypothetical protein